MLLILNGTLLPSNQVLLGITSSNIDSFYQAPTPSRHPYPFVMLLISSYQSNIHISFLHNTDWTTRQDTIAYISRISPQTIHNQMGMSSTLPCLIIGGGWITILGFFGLKLAIFGDKTLNNMKTRSND